MDQVLKVFQLQLEPCLLWPHTWLWEVQKCVSGDCVHAIECVPAAAKLRVCANSSEDEAL